MFANFDIHYSLKSVKKHNYESNTFLKEKTLKASAICYFDCGTGTFLINEKEYPIKPGTCFFLKPNMRIQMITSTEPIQLFYLTYLPISCKQIEIEYAETATIDLFKSQSIVVFSQVSIKHILLQLLGMSKNMNAHSFLKSQALFYELLHLLFTETEKGKMGYTSTIDKILDYMEQHYAELEDVGQLPFLAGLTPSSFCRAFKKATGKTPGNYLTEIRMNRAKELLVVPNSTLKEVAASIGYNDPLYFSRVFKKNVGVAPSAFNRGLNRRIAVVSNLLLQDHLLSLGITPIAAPSMPSYYRTNTGFPSYLEHQLLRSKPLVVEEKINTSELASVSPDVLIRMDFRNYKSDYLQNSSFECIYIEGFSRWQDYQRELARTLEREPIAEQVIKRINSLEERAKDNLRPFTRRGKWCIIRILPNEIRLYGNKGHALSDFFFLGLGLEPIDNISHTFYKVITLKKLITINPEKILIIWSERKDMEKVRKTSEWKELRAVKEQQIFIPNSREWDPWGPIGREHMLKESIRYFSQYM